MKALAVTVLLASVMLSAAQGAAKRPPNKRAAMVAGWALHFAQDARALQRNALRRREKVYGPSDPQVRADRRRLKVIGQKVRYFGRVKRKGEGRPVRNRRHSR